MLCANKSFPVPLSPLIKIAVITFVNKNCFFTAFCNAVLFPIISSKRQFAINHLYKVSSYAFFGLLNSFNRLECDNCSIALSLIIIELYSILFFISPIF